MGFLVFLGVALGVWVLFGAIWLAMRLAGFQTRREADSYDDGYL